MAALLHLPVRTRRDGSRVRMLCRNDAFEAGLAYYPPAIHHPTHVHERAQLSLLLGGGLAEQGDGRAAMPLGLRHAYKPAGAAHKVDFGPNGALILSIDFFARPPLGSVPIEWRQCAPAFSDWTRLLFGRLAHPEAVIEDMIAMTQVGEAGETVKGQPPRWIRRAAEQILDDPSACIAEVAATADVHRVHLSRAFQQHFGLSPTQFRLQAKSARALSHLIDRGASPGEAAAAAGFADQAHWNRAARATAGFAPGLLGRLLGH